jgi:DNA-binding transcriptional ArsR family regulator
MIRVHLSDPEIASTRIAPSPLWETVGSLLLLRDEDVPWPYDDWARRARDVLPTQDIGGLAPVLGRHPCLPDSLIPAPHAEASIDEELERVVRAPAADVRREIEAEFPDGVPADLEPFIENSSRAVGRFASALYAFWEQALAPDWPAMSALLERDILGRARAVARGGTEVVFTGLHERIRWRSPVLEIEKRWELDLASNGRGLVLVPLVFARAALLVSLAEGRTFALSYPARGVGSLWGTPATPVDGRLGALLGSGRAAVLTHLVEPRTTIELAECLGMAASTISHHLGVLQDADLTARNRVGRRVYYELNETGRALASLFGVFTDSGELHTFASDRMH